MCHPSQAIVPLHLNKGDLVRPLVRVFKTGESWNTKTHRFIQIGWSLFFAARTWFLRITIILEAPNIGNLIIFQAFLLVKVWSWPFATPAEVGSTPAAQDRTETKLGARRPADPQLAICHLSFVSLSVYGYISNHIYMYIMYMYIMYNI